MRKPIVFDVETKHTFREFSDHKDLGISVVGVYNYADDLYSAFFEDQLNGFFNLIENASILIGFNIISFDLPVLAPYYPGNIMQFLSFDILDDLRNKLGRRLSLDAFVKATLATHKSGSGLQAVDFYKEGKMEKLKKYCLDDVRLTKELFEYGVQNKEVLYLSPNGKDKIAVSWESYFSADQNDRDISLTLPF